MKRIARNSCLIVLLLVELYGTAQNIAAPTVWFSFNGTTPYNADYSNVKVQVQAGASVARIADRFNSTGAMSFPDKQSSLVVTDVAASRTNVKLFGYTNSAGNLPDTFTISCWVYVSPQESPLQARKIFYTDVDDSRFALIHKGSNIYLRRIAGTTSKHFDYLFGEPASFDAGNGWYHVILVMGRRPDKAKYCKLYVGKPANVKYDATGPRTVSGTSDVLATDFGGAYAFTGVQDFMNNSVTAWGFGNADDSDPVHGSSIAPVQRIDDFAVWDIALTEMQAHDLFVCQKSKSADQCWTSNTGTARKVPVQITNTDSAAEKTISAISVYPNPTSGELWVQLPAVTNSSTANLLLTDLNGKILFTRTIATGKTGQSVHLDIRSVTKASGIYMLQVIIAGKVQTFKIVIQ